MGRVHDVATPRSAAASADRLRAARLGAEVAEVDCEGQPQLAEAFAIRRVPTVLLANRYGQVETRLVGARAIGRAIDATV